MFFTAEICGNYCTDFYCQCGKDWFISNDNSGNYCSSEYDGNMDSYDSCIDKQDNITNNCVQRCPFSLIHKTIALSVDCRQDYDCLHKGDETFSKICKNYSMELTGKPRKVFRGFCSGDEGLECKESNSKYDIKQCYTSNTALIRYAIFQLDILVWSIFF